MKKHIIQVLAVWLIVALSSCATGERLDAVGSATSKPGPEKIRYYSLVYEGAMILDFQEELVILPSLHDALAYTLALCGEESAYICISSLPLDFAFPKCVGEKTKSWTINGRRYVLAGRYWSNDENGEPIYHVKAYEDGQLRDIFLFSYRRGLFLLGAIERQRSEEFEVNYDSVDTLYIPEGKGFGASVNGPECP